MKIAITTPTGHVGGACVRQLLNSGLGPNMVLLCRDPQKVAALARRGATVRQGSLEDVAFVTEATGDADELFWVTPPNPAAADLRAFQNSVGRCAAAAIRANNIQSVVNLSSLGAQQASGGGPINGLHDVEEILNQVSTNICHLRPGFFYENLLWQVPFLRSDSKLFSTMSPHTSITMVATADVGHVAARCLMDTGSSGQTVRAVHGPQDLSYSQVADILSVTLGREVSYVQISEDDARKGMTSSGASDSFIDAMLEMNRSMEAGTLRPAEGRTPQTTAPTTFAQFASEVLGPLVREPIRTR